MASKTVSRNVRNRRGMDPSVPKKRTDAVVSAIAATAADTIEITFQRTVQKSKLPVFKAGAAGAMTVASVTQVSGNVLELVFDGEVQGTDLIVEENDPGVRTPSGGFVPAGVYAIPTFP
jgi:hypothetical protein